VLGEGDECVAGPHDLVDTLDALGPECECRDGLRTSRDENLADAEQVRRGSNQRMHIAGRRGGLTTTTCSTPATCAGITDMSTVLGYAARPPGT